MTVVLLPNIKRDADLAVTRGIAERAAAFGVKTVMPRELEGSGINAAFLPEEKLYENADMVITVGGDGTIIHAAQKASEYSIPILGVNCGNVGFIAELERNELDKLDGVFTNNFTVEERLMFDVSANGVKCRAVNDAVITHGNVAKIIRLSLLRGGREIETYRADGVIVATPTGSTAYSLSAGGPIIEPTMECVVVTPICPHTLSSRSLVFSANEPTQVRSLSDGAFLTVDGQTSIPLGFGDTVDISVSKSRLRLIKLKDRGFFDVISDKLGGRNTQNDKQERNGDK